MQTARTRLQVDERREQLIKLGLELFGNVTYDELSIDEIAKKAGISKGLLYHYFPSKRAFYVAAVSEAARQLLVETDIGEPTAAPDLARVRLAITKFLEYVARHRKAYTFLLRSGVGADSEVAQIVEDTRVALLERILARLSKFGASPTDPATRLRLRGWLGFLEAASIDWAESGELELEEFRDLLVDIGGSIIMKVIQPQSSG